MMPSRLVRDRAGLAGAAAALGFPLALKIQSAAISHKTEAGGVRLGIADLPALEDAFDAVSASAARHVPGAAIDGVLLEPMAARGVEMIWACCAPSVVSVGAGGTTTELFKDVAYRLAPVDEAEATAMIRTLRSAPLLEGFRGAPPADLPALARLVSLFVPPRRCRPRHSGRAGAQPGDRPPCRPGLHGRRRPAGAGTGRANGRMTAMQALAFPTPPPSPKPPRRCASRLGGSLPSSCASARRSSEPNPGAGTTQPSAARWDSAAGLA